MIEVLSILSWHDFAIIITYAGQSVKDLFPNERDKRRSYFDSLPLVWKNFSQNSYITGYAEDTYYTTFNYMKKGFRSQVSSLRKVVCQFYRLYLKC